MAKKKPQKEFVAPTGFASKKSAHALAEASAKFQDLIERHDWRAAASQWAKVVAASRAKASERILILKKLIYEGKEMLESGLNAEAAAVYCKALAYDGNNLDCLRNLASIDLEAERFDQALSLINQALSIRQDIHSLWSIKVQCLASQGLDKEAQEALNAGFGNGHERRKVQVELVNRLAKKNPDASIRLVRQILYCHKGPLGDSLIGLLPIARQYGCFDLENSICLLQESKEVDPSLLESLFIFLFPVTCALSENKIFVDIQTKYRDWCGHNILSNPLPTMSADNVVTSRKLRIGIIGGDFCNHVVARFLLPLLENLDKKLYDIFCFSTKSRVDDEMRKRFEEIAVIKDVDPLYPRALAQAVRLHNLDLCIDAAGFTAYGASQAFAWRMAPLQLSMIGYPGSTFVPNMDLLLADEQLAPAEPWMYTEKLFKVAGGAFCMEHPDPSIAINPEPPQATHGFINFGILVNPYKYNRRCVRLWASVLKATPNSQIAIVRPECRSFEFQENVINEFKRYGIGKERIIIVNNHARGFSWLDCYNKIDVVLDTFPMTGGTSTYDAILMGVPVVTLIGTNYHQRLSASVLSSAGQERFIAESEAEYIRIASDVAQDIESLRKIRLHAVDLQAQPDGICDGKSYARRFQLALLSLMDKRRMLGPDWRLHLERLTSI